MTAKAFFDVLSCLGIGLMFSMAFWGVLDVTSSLASHYQEWLRSKRKINEDVPSLLTSVEDLRKRQYRLETELGEDLRKRQYRLESELDQIRRVRPNGTGLAHEHAAGLPASSARV